MSRSGKVTFICILFSIFVFVYCNPSSEVNSELDPQAEQAKANYVGRDVCASCHVNQHETFMHTGMGLSIDSASKIKSAADLSSNNVAVYDSFLNFYYRPFWRADKMFIEEFRLEGHDTVYRREEQVDHIIGSGQHTNSHLASINGYLYQLPLTYYTQDKRWDLPPGFEDGGNSRFSRKIEAECQSCHNGYPDLVEGSANKYLKIPNGIDCERCHGPGSAHVDRLMKEGEIHDTSASPDPDIVNPGRLNRELQMSLCQRCHLQGVAVLNEGKDWDDFIPGMHLKEVMNIFLPRFEGSNENFLMASQAERLRESKCYKLSEMSCITCHDPHVSVNATPNKVFTKKCLQCHNDDSQLCSKEGVTSSSDCITCHMPSSGSIDIPHVSITDHNIRVVMDADEQEKIKRFIKFENLAGDNNIGARVDGLLKYYEQFDQSEHILDSIELYFKDVTNTAKWEERRIHYYYLRGDWETLNSYVVDTKIEWGAWTCYRLGEAAMQLEFLNWNMALMWFERCVEAQVFNLEFQNKLGSALILLNRLDEAEKVYDFILNENDKMHAAHNNLGYVQLKQNKLSLAKQSLGKALALDPDYIPAMLNMARHNIILSKFEDAEMWLDKIFIIDPNDEASLQLQALLKQQEFEVN